MLLPNKFWEWFDLKRSGYEKKYPDSTEEMLAKLAWSDWTDRRAK